MGLKLNHIITLENNENFIVLNETMYKDKKYFLTMKINEKREVIANSIAILEEYISGFETYVIKVEDQKLIVSLTEIFRGQVKTT